MIKIRDYLLLFFTFLIYSFSLLFSKLASMQGDTINFVMFYCASVLVIGIYAIFWQLSLKRIPLSIAFPLKAITLVFSMIFGYVLFKEFISLKMIIGSVIVMFGIILIGKENE